MLIRAAAFLGMSVLLTIPTIGLADNPDSKWKVFVSTEGGYEVLMPGKPIHHKMTSDDESTDKDDMTVDRAFEGTTLYSVIYCDSPPEQNDMPLEKKLDAARDAINDGSAGTLTKESKVKLGDIPGRELHLTNDGLVVRNRFYIVDRRAYQVIVAGSPEAVVAKHADAFLDSFKLIKK